MVAVGGKPWPCQSGCPRCHGDLETGLWSGTERPLSDTGRQRAGQERKDMVKDKDKVMVMVPVVVKVQEAIECDRDLEPVPLFTISSLNLAALSTRFMGHHW